MTVQKHYTQYLLCPVWWFCTILIALCINFNIIMCMHSMFSIANVFYIINDSEKWAS